MITADELAVFARAIERRSGLRIEPDRTAAIVELVGRHARARQEAAATYVHHFDTDPAELRAVIGELTVGETYFFRHVEQFHAFADRALPERLAARERVSVLSAGCSTGEEAYTLAMLVRDRVGEPGRVALHAADINPASLARAEAGHYSRWALRATPADVEARWFRAEGKDLVVAPAIRAAVAFEQRSIVEESELWAPQRWDVVFCRNVIMYFTEARALEVIARIARSLAPGGYLFLGHAETLRGRSEALELCHSHGTFYYQRTPGTQVGSAPRVATSGGVAAAPGDTRWISEIQEASDRIAALAEGVPPPALPAPVLDVPADATEVTDVIDVTEGTEVRALIAEERFGEALASLAANGDDPLLRAVILAHTGRFTEAEAAARAALASGETAGAHYVLSLCRDSGGDAIGAVEHAQLAIALEPSFAMAHVHLGLLARRAGDRETAAHELARAVTVLEHEPAERLQLYGGGFGRQALADLCRAELARGGAA